MTIDSEHLRYIFGLKLKKHRQQRGFALKELSRRSGLSVSYLSEIEKGLKYPKPAKILALAEGLGVSFDDLVSLKLDQELDPVRALVSSPFITGFPFELFGLQAKDLLGLVTGVPEKAGALVRTFLEVGRSYDVRVEHFLFAALRSYQQLHHNYFPRLETAAAAFVADHGWQDLSTVDAVRLRAVLEEEHGCRTDEERIPAIPELAALRAVWVAGGDPELMVNGRLLSVQRAFQYGRELGYRVLGLGERSTTSSPLRVESFDQVIHDFQAAYFAGALLIAQQRFERELRALFARPAWSGEAFWALLRGYHATPETVFYRLSQIAPGRLGLTNLFFMRFSSEAGSGRYTLTKNLNMSSVPVPHGVGLNEHYCRRWPGLRTLDELATDPAAAAGSDDGGFRLRVQRSRFLADDSVFLVITLARPLVLASRTNASISVGFLVDETFRRRVRFWNDPAIPTADVDLTCERCPLTDCAERAAPPLVVEAEQARARRAARLEQLEQTVRGAAGEPAP